jgi:hypothetical protein
MAVNETIGKLDRYVQIVNFTTAKSSINSNTRTKVIVKNVWAKLSFKSSGEQVDQKVFDINKRDYVIHYDTDISSLNLQQLAVEDDGKTYFVTGANPDYGGRQMYILLNTEYRG